MQDVVFDLEAGQGCGFNRFMDINEVDIRENDEHLQINLTFEKVWKEVDSYNNNDDQNIKLDEKIKQLSEKCDNLFKSLQESIKRIENELMNRKKVQLPECPICFNDIGPGVKIAQCPSGHLLCWTCKDKLQTPRCPSCKSSVNNRAHGMENYIKTLLQ